MKKITIVFLISCSFLSAQVKTVVSPYGEKVTISPNVNNGLTATGGYIQLGGALTKPSVLTTTSAFTLALMGLQTGLGSDNVLVQDPATGVVRAVDATAFSPYFWTVKGNVGTDPATNFIGTIDQKDLLFTTNNIERIRINGTNGFTGIGLSRNAAYGTTPKYSLDVVDEFHIISNRVDYTSGRIIIENQQVDGGGQGSGLYILDGQSNGSRRQWYFGKGADGGNGSAKWDNFVLKSNLLDNFDSSGGSIVNGTIHLYVNAQVNRLGINTISPKATLDVFTTASNTDPLRLNNLQAGQTSETILTVDNNGYVHKTNLYSTGTVTCDGTDLITVNDPNVTSNSIIILTMNNPTNSSNNYYYYEGGPRVSGSNFKIKLSAGAPASYSFDYMILN